jgi:hypothetical protein
MSNIDRYAKFISYQLKLHEAVDGHREAAFNHWRANVSPVYEKHGLSPEFSKAVMAHKKLYPEHINNTVYNFHGSSGGEDPEWWDDENKKVYPLKQTWVPDRND